MKILATILVLLLICCKPSVRADYIKNDMKDGYSTKLSPDHQFILYYKFQNNPSDPSKWLTYFVTEAKTNILKKQKDSILADSIYWKSDHVLVIIPYREVMREKTDVNEKDDENEILIPINK